MSIQNANRKIYIKGALSNTPTRITENDRMVTLSLPLYQLNILESVIEKIENENSCEVFYTYMKDI